MISLFVLLMAIRVDNENLGLFAVAIPFLVSLSYYIEPEDHFFVWIHTGGVEQFLMKKIKIALTYSILISVPFILAYGISFGDSSYMLAALTISGLIWVITSLLAKYAHFPSELNILQGIAVTFTIIFPPLALIVIPVLYNKASSNLENYLV